MPSTPSVVYNGQGLLPFIDPDDADTMAVNLVASTTYTKGMVLGELTATPGTFKPYADGNSDGSQTAKLFLKYDCVTDASGNITLTSTAGQSGNELGVTSKTVAAYYKGTFKTTDLVLSGTGALDANGVADLGARIIQGTLANGIVRLG